MHEKSYHVKKRKEGRKGRERRELTMHSFTSTYMA